MSFRRQISWSSALRDMRSDRQPAVERRAYLALQHAAKVEALRAQAGAKLWTAAGGFSRAAIMNYAVAIARCERTNRPTRTWKACIAEALTYAWACAHAARRAGSH